MSMSEEQWSDLKKRLPPGVRVSGTVADHRPFGFFVAVDGFTELTALVEITAYADQKNSPIDVGDFPAVGSVVNAQVLYYADNAQQARLGNVELV